MLRSETYAGVWHYLKVRDTRKEVGTTLTRKLIYRPKEEQIAVAVPAIVSREVWEGAQQRLNTSRKKASGRPIQEEHLLRGMVFCACGRKMSVRGTKWNPDKPYNGQRGFYCTSAFGVVGEKRCQNRKTIGMNIAEKLVWDYVQRIILNPKNLIEELGSRQEKAKRKNQMVHERVALIGQELSGVENKQKLLLDLYLAGEIDREEFNEKKTELQHKVDSLMADRAEKEQWLKEQDLTADAVEEVGSFCASMAEGLHRATLEEKRRILQLLEVKVTFDGEVVTVGGGIPARKLFTSSLPQYR